MQPTQTTTTETTPVEKRYSCRELQELGGVSHNFIYLEIKRGKLPQPEKWGRHSRWKEGDVKQWLNSFSH